MDADRSSIMSAFVRTGRRLPPDWKPNGWHKLHGVAAGLLLIVVLAVLLAGIIPIP